MKTESSGAGQPLNLPDGQFVFRVKASEATVWVRADRASDISPAVLARLGCDGGRAERVVEPIAFKMRCPACGAAGTPTVPVSRLGASIQCLACGEQTTPRFKIAQLAPSTTGKAVLLRAAGGRYFIRNRAQLDELVAEGLISPADAGDMSLALAQADHPLRDTAPAVSPHPPAPVANRPQPARQATAPRPEARDVSASRPGPKAAGGRLVAVSLGVIALAATVATTVFVMDRLRPASEATPTVIGATTPDVDPGDLARATPPTPALPRDFVNVREGQRPAPVVEPDPVGASEVEARPVRSEPPVRAASEAPPPAPIPPVVAAPPVVSPAVVSDPEVAAPRWAPPTLQFAGPVIAFKLHGAIGPPLSEPAIAEASREEVEQAAMDGPFITAAALEQALRDAVSRRYRTVVLDIDSGGGVVYEMLQIVAVLNEYRPRVRLIGFVGQSSYAISAAAVIAFFCDDIVVAEDVSVGGTLRYIPGKSFDAAEHKQNAILQTELVSQMPGTDDRHAFYRAMGLHSLSLYGWAAPDGRPMVAHARPDGIEGPVEQLIGEGDPLVATGEQLIRYGIATDAASFATQLARVGRGESVEVVDIAEMSSRGYPRLLERRLAEISREEAAELAFQLALDDIESRTQVLIAIAHDARVRTAALGPKAASREIGDVIKVWDSLQKGVASTAELMKDHGLANALPRTKGLLTDLHREAAREIRRLEAMN